MLRRFNFKKTRFNLAKIEPSFFETSAGFSLIELLLSLSILAVLFGIGAPVYQSFQVKNDLDITANTWAQTLRRAGALSRAVDGDSAWGVKLESAGLILFKGTSYILRDTNFDEIFVVPTSISASGLTEIVFNKFSGFPQSTGTTTLTTSTNEVRDININAKGTLTY